MYPSIEKKKSWKTKTSRINWECKVMPYHNSLENSGFANIIIQESYKRSRIGKHSLTSIYSRSITLLWDLSAAIISPSSFIRIAIAVVFPPGAAHMSNIRSPFLGSTASEERTNENLVEKIPLLYQMHATQQLIWYNLKTETETLPHSEEKEIYIYYRCFAYHIKGRERTQMKFKNTNMHVHSHNFWNAKVSRKRQDV